MSVYDHPNKPGWQMIKISHGRKEKPEYIPYCGSRDEALVYERELRGIADRSDPGFLDKIPAFKIHYKNRCRPRAVEVLDNSFKHLTAFFSAYKMRHITSTPVEAYKAWRLEAGVKRKTINIELSGLSSYFTWHNETHHTHYPLPKAFSKRETPSPKKIPLTLAEIASFLKNLDGDIRTILLLQTVNGLRKTESLNLTAANIDLAGRNICFEGKGGKWRMVPISYDSLYKDLEAAVKRHPEGPLFPSPIKPDQPWTDIRKPIKRAAAAAGITKHIHPHLLRHSFATALMAAGVNARIIQELLGHEELDTTEKYMHVNTDVMRQATDLLTTMLGENVAKCGIQQSEETWCFEI